MNEEARLLLISYYCLINLVAFLVFGADKGRAKKKKYRVSENMLMFLCVLGGGGGALLGMKAFRHKTKHAKFIVGVPAMFVIHVLLIIWIAVG